MGTERTAPDPDVYRTLVESTRAIPWSIHWDSKRFSYIGPQIEGVLGWSPESWKSVEDWVARIHPEDRERVFGFCVAQSLAGVDHEADYRALREDGGYVWIRDVVHVVRDAAGNVASLVGFMFDITERKRSEEQLAELQRTLERLSYQDGLTGVANRRMFDTVLAREWEAARRTRQPLSLVLFDIDCFKQYNDHYGHLQGDECLRGVAQALLAASTRAQDFVGRFGGEEFVLVLPGTDAAGAVRVAERCRERILALRIAHARSGTGWVTASAGVATRVAGDGDPSALVEEADRRLYQAKQAGRNRVRGEAA
ncbi:MAG TPA: sensor domain-containing diguanylate cyclase [Xanthomonadaceae bacterium]|nr:sensor domain-containing diguanylate cyclase [Xanthomonadaceae bacterium]